MQVMLHAPRMYSYARHARRDYFSPLSGEVGHRGKIVPGSAGAIPVHADHVQLVLLELLWRFRARRKVPVEFYSQLTGKENKHFSNSRSLTLCTVIGCAPTRHGRGMQGTIEEF